MKKKFPEYYYPTDSELEKLWEDCIFIFDTSVILNLYQYSVKSRDEFLSILKKISDRIWIPYQVGKEYHSRRPHIIREQKEKYLKIQDKIDEIKNKFISDIEKEKSVEYHPFIDKNELKKKIGDAFTNLNSYLKDCEKKYPDLTRKDNIGEEIDKLFEDKIGDEYTREKLKELNEAGKKRYEQKIPPGFSDQQKGNDKQYGDYISWVQIIEYAKMKNKPVIFVTDDEKNDWWLIHDYQKSTQEIILPHPELIKEFVSETNNRFYMYNSENFMKSYRKFLKEKVSNNTIKEVRNLRNRKIHQNLFDLYSSLAYASLLKDPKFLEAIKQQENLQKQFNTPEFLEAIKRLENFQKLFGSKFFEVTREKIVNSHNQEDIEENNQD
jgi:hypothetical protein